MKNSQQKIGSGKEKEIRASVNSFLHQKGWDVLYRLGVEVSPTQALVEAGINREDWMINIKVDPDCESKLEDLIAKTGIKVEKPKQKLLFAGCAHEEGHWSVCPFDRDYVEDILNGIGLGLKAGGLKDDEVIQYTPEVANIFMDFIDNSVNALHPKDGKNFGEGIGLFYLNQVQMPECSPGYLLFVDTQMKTFGRKQPNTQPKQKHSFFARLFGRKPAEELDFYNMAESNPNYKKVKKDSKRLLETIIPATLAEKAYEKGLDAYDAKLVVEEMTKEKLWGKKAKDFAQVFAPYAKQLSQEMQECCGNSDSKDDKKGKDEKEGSGSGKHKEHKHDKHGRCCYVREMLEDEESKKDIIKRALQKGRKAGPAGIPYVTQQESFETAYELKAEEIVLKYFKEDEDAENPTFDLFYMRDRKLEEDESLDGKINWSKTLFVENGGTEDVWLHKREVPYEIEEELTPGRKSTEDILFVIDVSRSMGWSGKPLDRSKYDLALQAVFGCLKGLEKLGRAANSKYGMVLFSNSTTFSGWEDYYSLDKFKKLVFTGYQGGGTELNAEVMQKVSQQNKDRFLTLLISDGDIYNPDASETIKKIIEAGNDVVQFSIQGNTGFSQTIKKHGAEIVNVNKPEDLSGIVVENIKERYK